MDRNPGVSQGDPGGVIYKSGEEGQDAGRPGFIPTAFLKTLEIFPGWAVERMVMDFLGLSMVL